MEIKTEKQNLKTFICLKSYLLATKKSNLSHFFHGVLLQKYHTKINEQNFVSKVKTCYLKLYKIIMIVIKIRKLLCAEVGQFNR